MDLSSFSIIDMIRKIDERPRQLIRIAPSSCFNLLPRQEPIFQELRNSRRFVLQCPTGWGKSKIIQFLGVYNLHRNRDLKLVIIVPQNVIGNSFSCSARLNVPEIGEQRWSVIRDLTADTPDKSRELRLFLLRGVGPDDSLQSRIILTTHSAFCQVSADLDRSTFDNTILVIDECHHIQSSDIEDDDDAAAEDSMNQLGNIVGGLADTNTLIWLVTATFGRGDGGSIISADMMNQFDFLKVEFDEYLGSMSYLRGFTKSFLIYDDNQFAGLQYLLNLRCPTLVYCPPLNGRFLGNCSKADFIGRIVESFRAIGGNLWKPGSVSDRYIVDLTDGTNKAQKVRLLRDDPQSVETVIAVGRMREGADWPALQRTIDFAPSMTSMPLRIQKLGRGIRDYPGKTLFQYYTCLPRITSKDNDQLQAACNEYFAQLVAGLIDLAYYHDDFIWRMPTDSISDTDRTRLLDRVLRYLACSENPNIDTAIQYALLNTDIDLTASQIAGIKKSLHRLLQEQNETIINTGWIKEYRKTLITDLGFNSVNLHSVAQGLRIFCSEVCGIDTFQNMRRILGQQSSKLSFFEMAEKFKSAVQKPKVAKKVLDV